MFSLRNVNFLPSISFLIVVLRVLVCENHTPLWALKSTTMNVCSSREAVTCGAIGGSGEVYDDDVKFGINDCDYDTLVFDC